MSSSHSDPDRAPGAWPRWLSALQAIGSESTNGDVLHALEACLSAQEHWLSRLANTVAVLSGCLPRLLWLGIYLVPEEGDHLFLGPCAGGTNFARLGWGEGLVGTCARGNSVEIAGDVRRIAFHVPADRAARAEAAFPVVCNGKVVGVVNALAADAEALGLVELELLSGYADLLSCHWPRGWRQGVAG